MKTETDSHSIQEIQSVPHRDYTASVINTNRLTPYREIMTIYGIMTQCGENMELLLINFSVQILITRLYRATLIPRDADPVKRLL